jgi:hypothetical protein
VGGRGGGGFPKYNECIIDILYAATEKEIKKK